MWLSARLATYKVILLLLCSSTLSPGNLQSGELAPDFSLLSQAGAQVSLKSFRGRWVVAFFYGTDITADVALEARDFQRDAAEYAALNTAVIGIGNASPKDNALWAGRDELAMPLLSDIDGATTKAYGVPSVAAARASDNGLYEVIVSPGGRVVTTRIVTSDVEGESVHMLARLRYTQDNLTT